MKINKTYLRFFGGLSIGLLIAVLVALNALLIWVATGPRSLDKLTPYIESAFNPGDGSFSVKIAHTWLIWDGWQHPIDIRLKEVSVITKEGQTFSNFPEIAIGVHLPSLMYGKILPTSVAINHPIISLFQNDDNSINFGFRQEETQTQPSATIPFAAVIAPLTDNNKNNNLRKLRYVSIRNADLSVGSVSKGVFFEAVNVDMVGKRSRKIGTEFLVNGKIRYGDYQSGISSHFVMKHDKSSIDGTIDFKGVEISTLAKLFSDEIPNIPLNMPISGSSAISLDMDGKPQHVTFNIDGGQGVIESPELTAPLNISWLHAEGQANNSLQDIQIDKMTGEIDGMLFSAKGVISLSNDDMAIRAEASIKNIPGEKVPVLWPTKLAPLSREWITTNISDAKVSEASIKTNINFGDLKKPILPKEAIDATIALDTAKIKYLPEHPETTHVKSVIHVDGMALDAEIISADYMKDTKITNGRLLIEDLNLDNPYIKINFDAESSAKDIVKFLDLPRLKHTERLNLKTDGAEGTVKGKAELGFYFFAPKDANGKEMEPDIDYEIKGEVNNVAQPALMKKFDIKNATGSITINKNELTFKGKGVVNGATADEASVKYLFKPENGMDTFIEANAIAPKESLARFGYPDFSFLKGNLAVKANVKLGTNTEISQANIDLTNAAIDARSISWAKAAKEPATLDITAEKKDGVTKITSFNLKAKDIEAKGAVNFNKEITEISSINMDKLQLGNTNLSTFNYQSMPNGFMLTAIGKSADLSGFLDSRSSGENTFSFENFPAVQIKASIDKMYMASGRTFTNFKGALNCSALICENADISGMIGDKPFDFRILRNPKGKRQLTLHAQNAGEFLKATSIYDKMEGGDLSITGNYEDSARDSVLRGKLYITEHAIKKAPVLAKILSLASLTGFIDTLQGNGIRFTKMVIPFTLQNDVINVSKARAFGNAIGITADGSIVFPKITFDIKGTVVPSYAANTILGKLPLIGNILTGGEGKGIFAGSYKVKGTYQDPDVSVNPLSILTPGFLRGIFDGGD